MKIAVIDLGTNTFNLIIAQKINNNIEIIYAGKKSVKLGKGGIGNNIILPDAIIRAHNAISSHIEIIKNYDVGEIIAIGTSALRTAENADEFIAGVKQHYGIDILVISGEREASLIFKGVRTSLLQNLSKFLILDIGGGSNEFILADSAGVIWKQSFPLGMARIIERFRPSDPISKDEIIAIEQFFENELLELFTVINNHPVDCLIGAEGAFESFYNTIQHLNNSEFCSKQYTNIQTINIDQFFELHNTLIHSSELQRLQMKGIEPYRVEMVVPASIFVNFIIKKLKIENLKMSPFSLKEGVVWENFFEK